MSLTLVIRQSQLPNRDFYNEWLNCIMLKDDDHGYCNFALSYLLFAVIDDFLSTGHPVPRRHSISTVLNRGAMLVLSFGTRFLGLQFH